MGISSIVEFIRGLLARSRTVPSTTEVTVSREDAAIQALLNASAPASYTNLRLHSIGAPRTWIGETALYTDTRILGEYEIGPMKFINTISHDPHWMEIRPAIVLRLSSHWPSSEYKMADNTSDEHYHGGDDVDEIAALISLILGIRVQAGPITRDFSLRGDPLGTPTMIRGMKTIPTLYPSHQNPMVPRLAEPVNLTNLTSIGKISNLPPDSASAFIKSSRSYQTALWFADSHPEMSWLFLVSSIETAASNWARRNFVDSSLFLPDQLVEILRAHNCPDSVDQPISAYLRETTRSTRKFIDFLIRFLPYPPLDRPEHENLRVNFTSGELKKDFQFIYKCRSRALHTGVPFPKPMCMPRRVQLKEERNISLGMSALGATWSFRKYRPIHFHMFEHIVRGALLRWLGEF
jgi:hypothetical protein